LHKLRQLLALMADPRAPKLPRLAVLAAVVYVVWPIDLIPDFAFPVVGYLDDLVVLWMSLRWLLKPLSSEGDQVTSPPQTVDGVVDIAARPLPKEPREGGTSGGE